MGKRERVVSTVVPTYITGNVMLREGYMSAIFAKGCF